MERRFRSSQLTRRLDCSTIRYYRLERMQYLRYPIGGFWVRRRHAPGRLPFHARRCAEVKRTPSPRYSRPGFTDGRRPVRPLPRREQVQAALDQVDTRLTLASVVISSRLLKWMLPCRAGSRDVDGFKRLQHAWAYTLPRHPLLYGLTFAASKLRRLRMLLNEFARIALL